MRQPILSPDKFAEWFNQSVPGACRPVTVQDARDLTACGLVGKYGYFGRDDIETVRAILLYEQLRDERERKACLKDAPRTCNRCDQPLPTQSDGRRGRPNEYCADCEPYRNRSRYENWKVKHASASS